jgi:hypothetical protein
LSERLRSPETWFKVALALGFVGSLSLATHTMLPDPVFLEVGLCLLAPLLVAIAVLVLVVVPWLLLRNRRARREGP